MEELHPIQETETKKKLFNVDFKNLSEEEKKKYLGYGFLGLVAVGILTYGIINNSSEENEKVDDFDNPQKELSEYNNKSEAINDDGTTPSDDLTGQFQSDSINQQGNSEMEALDQTLANMGTGGGTAEPVQNNTGGYSQYGSNDMYGGGANNSVGYSNQNQMPTNYYSPQPTQSYSPQPMPSNEQPTAPQRQVIKTYVRNNGSTNTGNTSTAQVPQNNVIKGFIKGTSQANNMVTEQLNTVKLTNAESFSVQGVTIPKNSTIIGYATLTPSRVKIKVKSILIGGAVIDTDIDVLDNRGQEGVAITGGTGKEIQGEVSSDVAEDIGNNGIVNKIPGGKGVIGKILTKKPKAILNVSQIYLKINQ